MGFLKSPEIPLEGLIKIPLERLIKIPLEGNFFRFPRESEKTRTRAVGFLKTPEIPLEGNFFRFPREAEKSRTKAVRFLKSTEIPLEGLIFHPLHVPGSRLATCAAYTEKCKPCLLCGMFEARSSSDTDHNISRKECVTVVDAWGSRWRRKRCLGW